MLAMQQDLHTSQDRTEVCVLVPSRTMRSRMKGLKSGPAVLRPQAFERLQA